MFIQNIKTRFYETDALGHINNAVPLQWFEACREPIFKIFTPDLDPKKWKLILAHNSIDYLAQVHYGQDIKVHTFFEKIGNSSMTITHHAYQAESLVLVGKVVMIHFDYEKNSSVPIPYEIRSELEKHLGK